MPPGYGNPTVANRPYHIARLREDERARCPLDRLSDWAIASPHGYFIPDALPLLQERLDRGG